MGEKENKYQHEPTRTRKCYFREPTFNTENITIEELNAILHKLKKRKAAGPDDLPIEFYKWLDQENRTQVLNLLNHWWNTGDFPKHKLDAYVASIFKKGDPKKQENYRPISLLNSIYKIYTAIMQKRIAAAIDDKIQETQYGFRKAKSTTMPLACIRRILERAEASKNPCFLVFLDWEKAFDRVRQDKLIEALTRIGFPPKYIQMIKSIYNEPHFAVRINNNTSNWKRQTRGIRQGCPLSPYLFIILMTVMFNDIHHGQNFTRGTLPGINFTELLYADDTALITSNVNAMNRLIALIEQHADYYGLNFNYGKCVSMNFNTNHCPKFMNGTKLETPTEAEYLGSTISDKHLTRKEVSGRISTCFATLQKMHFFWRKANCPAKFKLTVFDAVIRAKLVYGLDVMYLPQVIINRLNVLQLKGLRKILKLDTTYINRANTNQVVFTKSNELKNPNRIDGKNIAKFGTYLENKQQSFVKHIARLPFYDPIRQCTLEIEGIKPIEVTNRRVGRPRQTWAYTAYQQMFVKHGFGTKQFFNANSNIGIDLMKEQIMNKEI